MGVHAPGLSARQAWWQRRPPSEPRKLARRRVLGSAVSLLSYALTALTLARRNAGHQ